MENHSYRCASCDHLFESSRFETRCPRCREKVLIHVKGEPRRKSTVCGGSCSGCSGCAH